MGEVYDKPRADVTASEKDRSLRYQIMDVVDQIRWLPGFGYERELDWLRTMSDWMISKKRYWGLSLPIWECASCGHFDVIGSHEELERRAVAGWSEFDGHTPHRPYVDAVKISCSACGAETSRIPDVGNPWLDAGIVPFSTMHYRSEPDYWAKWFPADFITESFPGQFRNWFYSLLAMSTVLRREPPFKTILGYATLFGEDGRPMHKSWGNSIEFNEAAERMGVDVMRWMYAKSRPEENILFGYHTADEVRRELLVLWNVYVFFVTYARLAAWAPSGNGSGGVDGSGATVLDRWILSRSGGLARDVQARLVDFDATGATRLVSAYIDDLSTWYLRRSRSRMRVAAPAAERDTAFATLHAALTATSRVLAPILPFLSEAMYQNLVVATAPALPDSVHLTAWVADEMKPHVDESLEASMATLRRAVELTRTLRGQAELRLRQPLRQMWLAIPGGRLAPDRPQDEADLLDLLADETNVKQVTVIGDQSELVERRVKPLLPKIGKRLGAQIPAVMAAARANEVEYLASGGVKLAGVELAPDEVEILATPRPGTAVAHDEGLVVVIDTEIDDALRAEGDARELVRAVQDLRKQAGLELDDMIDLWLAAPLAVLAPLRPYEARLLADALVSGIRHDDPPTDALSATQQISSGEVALAIRRSESPA
jgi:isoleucyl-tRNA synthetase